MHLQQPAHGPDKITLNNMLNGLRGLREDSAQHACDSLEDKEECWY